ncbi:sigma-54-dependent transcriptional regulator [Pseudoalteromonas denitrificans]|uniref:DNA-binding transcriptional response regulator, NtrC family, contains REC, AAA-type ATPase, and a Fis-type DNA-binding domains n=1 Tax=Pseudoalteromonas denitrificans DSM 6059 TaxID=1123010 RepID=A0A1I1QDG6_9GAMM|nr:sigma-54 dependent transcriptional regulator [Pseudoalteromonas denitrificans]SFD20214.1 DNA-binding transcriptional response regulator, NtrC family, contains REC, AAA-type ATPase, and a Fis-type DNA-binding domains [Pseudoalteromonas denitrificans DSM 6059]
MKKEGRILIVDDDEDILTAGKLLLKRQFSHVSTCNLPEHIPTFISTQHFDAILLDMNFGPGESSGKQGFHWLKKILEINPQSVIIMITAHGGVDVAVEAMKLGATDFISKPWQNEKVIATVSTAVLLGQSRCETQSLRAANQVLVQDNNQLNQQEIIAQSDEMLKIQTLLQHAAPTDANILILGENGTGKELIARDLHQKSLRAHKVFMSVDLGAISESLFESELFGHKKGAFTGAHHDRIGRLKAADGGTLFLDEIGNLPLHLQAKLLTILEQRKVTPLGANEAVPFDVRVVSATNISKNDLKTDACFRQDLLFRLNTVEINLPPLRKRIQDIEPIAQYFISLYSKKYQKPEKELDNDALIAIKSNSWPGNIRELRHAVERAVILSQTHKFTCHDFQIETVNKNHIEKHNVIKDEPTELPQDLNLEVIEKQAISQALKKHRYNISHTAKELGLTRAALYRRMEKHGL